MMKTYVLHGFLGKPEDWKGLNQGMFLNGGLEAVDLYDFPFLLWKNGRSSLTATYRTILQDVIDV